MFLLAQSLAEDLRGAELLRDGHVLAERVLMSVLHADNIAAIHASRTNALFDWLTLDCRMCRVYQRRLRAVAACVSLRTRLQEGEARSTLHQVWHECRNEALRRRLPLPMYQVLHWHRHLATSALQQMLVPMRQALTRWTGIDGWILYQTSSFWKESSGVNQQTPFHVDLLTQPIDTNDFYTFWCPLQALRRNESVLQFASKSHVDMAFPFWFDSPSNVDSFVSKRYSMTSYDYLVGDCSVHSGWLWHRAPMAEFARHSITFSFVPVETRRLKSFRKQRLPLEDELSWNCWIDVVEAGQLLSKANECF